MRFLIILALISLSIGLWTFPEVRSCFDPGGIGCIFIWLVNIGFFSVAIILGIISFILFAYQKKNRKRFHKKFFITVALIFFLTNFSGLLYLDYQKISSNKHVMDLRRIDNIFILSWKKVHNGENGLNILSVLDELEEFNDSHTKKYETLSIYMALAMRHNDMKPVFLQKAKKYFYKEENVTFAGKFLLDVYFDNDFNYIDTHDKYRRFFSLLNILNIKGYKEDEIYNLDRRYVLKDFTFSSMIEKGFDDLALEGLSLVRTPLENDLETAITINNIELKNKVINKIIEKASFQEGKKSYVIDDLILIYGLLKNEENINVYLSYLDKRLKKSIQNSTPEQWEFRRTQIAQEEYISFYESVKGHHSILDDIPEHINDYYLLEEEKIQEAGKNNYMLFISYVTQTSGLNHPYTSEAYKLFINDEFRQSGWTSEKGKIEYKIYSGKVGDKVEVRTSVGTWRMLITPPPNWNTEEGLLFRIYQLSGGGGNSGYLIRTFESQHKLKITGIYNKVTARVAKTEYEKWFGEGWLPIALSH